jgi:hypothetical protein
MIQPSLPFTHFTYGGGKGWSTLRRAANEACYKRHSETSAFAMKLGKSDSHGEQSHPETSDVGAAFDSVTGYGDMTGMKQVCPPRRYIDFLLCIIYVAACIKFFEPKSIVFDGMMSFFFC